MIVGLGLDVVDIVRAEQLLDDKGDRALSRLFTDEEVAYATARARPALHLAARLAAKEAAFKALSGSEDARSIGWREVEVIPREGRSPTLALSGRAEERARELGVERIWITLSHTDTTAAAVVILERS
jgi:holo-[acyl-carrier protein] synthase